MDKIIKKLKELKKYEIEIFQDQLNLTYTESIEDKNGTWVRWDDIEIIIDELLKK